MTDQQPQAPQCPQGHGPMLFHSVGCHWYCRECPGCGEMATPAMIAHTAARAGHTAETAMQDKYAAMHQRAEQAEARVRELEAERDRLREAIRGAISYAGRRWSEWGERAEGVADILEQALNCPRCGNPQPDCQCHGSAAMEHERAEEGEEIEGVGKVPYEDSAPHGRCWCEAPLEWGEDINLSRKPESRIVLRCSASLDHRPCPGPAPYGYCNVHPGEPMQRMPPDTEYGTGYLYCPRCNEEVNDVNP